MLRRFGVGAAVGTSVVAAPRRLAPAALARRLGPDDLSSVASAPPSPAASVRLRRLALLLPERQRYFRLGEGPVPLLGDGRPNASWVPARGDDSRERRVVQRQRFDERLRPRAHAQGGSSPEDAPPVADDVAARQGGDGLAPAYYNRDALAEDEELPFGRVGLDEPLVRQEDPRRQRVHDRVEEPRRATCWREERHLHEQRPVPVPDAAH